MYQRLYYLTKYIVMFVVVFTSNGFSQTHENWPEYVAIDYDILPDITYSIANNTELKLDLYLPRNNREPHPTLIYFHGGGWVSGQKERNVLYLLPYISFGWAVVNVEYRLSRNSLAPAAVEDGRCALRWVITHAKEYNLDPDKIVLTGPSAGGHLALITGMLPEKSIFDRHCPTDDRIRWSGSAEPEIHVAAIINWYGITDVVDLLDGTNAKHYTIEWFGSMSNREELAKEVSPLNYVRAGLPPILTIHGNKDNIVPYSHATRLHSALDKIGSPNQLHTINGGRHGEFNREEMLQCYTIIKDFLHKENILKKE